MDEFLERDGDGTWEAVLSISIAFMDENEADISRKILFQKTYHTSKPCRQKNPRALVAAMSAAMSDISGKIINDLYRILALRNKVLSGFQS